MRLLLSYGADPNFITTTNESALMLAAGVGWPLGQGYMRTEREIREALELCLALGMDVNRTNSDGVTALMGAAHKGDNATIRFLVDHGAKLDATDSEGRTALVWAGGVFGKSGLSIQPPRRQPHSEALLRELMNMPVAANTPE
jgi:ankyrin repeat protein